MITKKWIIYESKTLKVYAHDERDNFQVKRRYFSAEWSDGAVRSYENYEAVEAEFIINALILENKLSND